MEVVNDAFSTARQLLKSTVPPCTETMDNSEYYEVRSINPERSEDILFGYVIKHTDSITIGFNDKLEENNMERLFSKYLLQKMNEHKRIHIHEMNHQLREDLQEAINHLIIMKKIGIYRNNGSESLRLKIQTILIFI